MEQRFIEFTALINNISRSIRRMKTFEMEAYNLKSVHACILFNVYYNENISIKELTILANVDKAATSRNLKFLREEGYIEYEDEQHKGYKNKLVLTEKGKEVGKHVFDKIGEVIRLLSVEIPPEDREVMYRCLNLINDRLESIVEEEE